MKKRIRLALAVALALALTGASALATTSVQFSTATKAYKTWSTSSRSVNVPAGLKVTLLAHKNGWAQVKYKNVVAYVPLKYLDLTVPLVGYTNTTATVYRNPGSDKLGTLNRGRMVYVVGLDGSYYRVQNKAGTVRGYILKSELSKQKPVSKSLPIPSALHSTTSDRHGDAVEYVIYLAQNLIGAPYAVKANPPATFDCAKFIYYLYTQVLGSGSIRGTTYEQGYDERYEMVDRDHLKRGDLVFFDTVEDSDPCDHVGVYLGDGYFIHASSVAEEVMVSQLDTGYYARTFSWGRRVFT